ncbi:uncharacterized protein METZ01_LOCUS204629 [marine metagenome]|uniref:Uncharacterized protein n=1 Tax=marine metagenome TaxID=408172 RepID=A0A382EMW5_9ZZZZ
MALEDSMKIKLLLHDEDFNPKPQNIDLPKQLENQVLKEDKIKAKFNILDRLVE